MSFSAFLEATAWASVPAVALAGDASGRRYYRLNQGGRSAILMDAPVDHTADRQSFRAFRAIGLHLRDLGLSAPQELHADPDKGLILMEDFGDLSLSRLLLSDPDAARFAYHATADLLPRLWGTPPQGLAAPDAAEMAHMVDLTFDFIPNSAALRDALLGALTHALVTHTAGPSVLSLRDVHADNLLWLPERNGAARVGLLDYQDALLLPQGYDLASLLDDPRREVPEIWREEIIAAHSTPERIAALSLQRNLRILGIFRRLSTDFGKPTYAAFLPRTCALVSRAADVLPALRRPTAELLERIAPWSAP